MPDSKTYTLSELCEHTGVSERTVRYYVSQGLLPSPGAGRGARWSHEHLQRLRLVLQLKERHLPLAEIRRRLEAMSAAEVSALLGSSRAEEPASSASDYVQQVLAGMRPSSREQAPSPERSSSPVRTTWERLQLAPDVELHIRRPLSRQQDRLVRRLLRAAQTIFDQEEP